ncbi:MAG: ANTAR domain-containing protein [Gemmatales bacterium]|nr:ANTAR domain-containing protein [Gemmatales bacterium]MDW7994208.1 ANTAR domain-containing protein [Gemmatales bacterium]
MLRLWLLGSGADARHEELRRWLGDLQQATSGQVTILGTSEWSRPLPGVLRSGQVDVVVCRLSHHEEELAAAFLAGLPVPTLFVLDTPLRSPHRLLQLVKQAAFVPISAGCDGIYAAIISLQAALERQAALTREIERLRQQQQQRLVIEKAKAQLIQQHGWSEEQAYRHLRRLARQQRRRLIELAAEMLKDVQSAARAQLHRPS